jgi:hypothetical protein
VCVTVGASGGAPVVVDRRRIETIGPGTPSQPYHHDAVGMPLAEAEELVARVRASVMALTLARLSELRAELQPRFTLVGITLRKPPLDYVPVTVAEAHKSYAVMCRADALMYHDALCAAAGDLGLSVELRDRGTEVEEAAQRLEVTSDVVERFLQTAGERLGPPWRKEHRLAAASALAALAARARVSLLS